MNAHKRKVFFYLYLSVAIFIILSAMSSYRVMERSKEDYEESSKHIQGASWAYVEGVLAETLTRTQGDLESESMDIVKDVEKTYQGNTLEIESDLDMIDFKSSQAYRDALKKVQINTDYMATPLEKIITENVEKDPASVLQKDFESEDPNDSFVIMKRDGSKDGGDKILDDGFIMLNFSKYLSDFSEYDNLRDSALTSYNPQLTEKALEKIIKQDVPDIKGLTNLIGWQLRKPSKSDGYNLDGQLENFSLETLRDLYYDSDLNIGVFKSFDFLYPEYLMWNADLSGKTVDTNSYLGNPEARQLVLVHSFNLSRILAQNPIHMKNLELIKNYQKVYYAKYHSIVGTELLNVGALLAIFIMLIFAINTISNYAFNDGEVVDDDTGVIFHKEKFREYNEKNLEKPTEIIHFSQV